MLFPRSQMFPGLWFPWGHSYLARWPELRGGGAEEQTTKWTAEVRKDAGIRDESESRAELAFFWAPVMKTLAMETRNYHGRISLSSRAGRAGARRPWAQRTIHSQRLNSLSPSRTSWYQVKSRNPRSVRKSQQEKSKSHTLWHLYPHSNSHIKKPGGEKQVVSWHCWCLRCTLISTSALLMTTCHSTFRGGITAGKSEWCQGFSKTAPSNPPTALAATGGMAHVAGGAPPDVGHCWPLLASALLQQLQRTPGRMRDWKILAICLGGVGRNTPAQNHPSSESPQLELLWEDKAEIRTKPRLDFWGECDRLAACALQLLWPGKPCCQSSWN